MEARPPLDPAWLDSVARATGTRDRIRIDHAGVARDYTLFFITGHPRSGTHWLSSLLNLHPHIHSDGEFFFDALREGFDRLSAWKWLAVGADTAHRQLAASQFQDSVRRLLVAIAPRKPGATHIGDHTPRPLNPYLPGSSHLVTLRDGRDVLVSWTFHQLRVGGQQLAQFCGPGTSSEGMEPARRAFAADPAAFDRDPHLLLCDERWVRAMARQWADHVTHDAQAIAAISAGTLDARALLVRYEAVHADAARELARMVEFLGLNPALCAPVSATTGTAALTGNADPRSFFRAGRVGDWTRYFSADALRWFNAEAANALAASGYATEGAP